MSASELPRAWRLGADCMGIASMSTGGGPERLLAVVVVVVEVVEEEEAKG